METIMYRGYTIVIRTDEDPISPREYDNNCVMVCAHKRYALGDDELPTNQESFLDDFKSYIDGKGLKLSDIIYLPLYLYDHSGLRISTGAFSCRWDSGQVGYVYITKADVRKLFGIKRISSTNRLNAVNMIRNEVKEYDSYLSGDMWGMGWGENESDIEISYGYSGYEDTIKLAKGEIDFTINKKILGN